QTAQAGNVPVSTVGRGKLHGVAAERGRLEASKATDVYNPLKDMPQILSILPDGANVKKGDLIVELDPAALKERRINQAITEESARAVSLNAKLAHEVAQIAVTEYLEGVYKQEFVTLSGAAVEAQAAMKRAGNRLARTKQARQRLAGALNGRGTTPADIIVELDLDDRIEEAEAAVLRTQVAVEQAQTRLMVLQKYTKDKVLKELHAEVEKARSAALQKQEIWKLEQSKLSKLDEQIESCKIHALDDGVLILANDPFRDAGNPPTIAVGAVVRERQKLFSTVDLNGPLQVIARVPEAMIDRVHPGLKARVKVDALPNMTYTGVVTAVPTLPDPTARTRPEKVFSTTIKFDEAQPNLRPGFTASVEILVDELEDVLLMPLAAVLHEEGRTRVAVKKSDGTFEVRDVTLGASNDTHVEVMKGIHDGEFVALDPVAAVKGK
ncbi:efflux RND transporter periplasmic adaptor subunit, partial [Singulisphaera rosea]